MELQSSPKKRAKILGGGISGLSSAIVLARAGVDVTVYELLSNCGENYHGDLQGIENFVAKKDALEEMQENGLSVDFIKGSYTEIVGVMADGDSYRLRSDHPMVYLTKRGTQKDTLDSSLKRQALEVGVSIRFRETIPEKEADIVATGTKGLPHPHGLGYATMFSADCPDGAWVLLDDDGPGSGYSYLLVMDGYACMCTAVFDRRRDFREKFEEAIPALERASGIEVPARQPFGSATGYSVIPQFGRNGQIVAGEAAGLQDALWGFGIRQSIRSGVMAAKGWLGEFDYHEQATREFGKKHAIGLTNRWLWEVSGQMGKSLFLKVGTHCDFRRMMHRIYRPDPVRLLISHFAGKRIENLFAENP